MAVFKSISSTQILSINQIQLSKIIVRPIQSKASRVVGQNHKLATEVFGMEAKNINKLYNYANTPRHLKKMISNAFLERGSKYKVVKCL